MSTGAAITTHEAQERARDVKRELEKREEEKKELCLFPWFVDFE
jgi:hypothetical protein